MRWIAISGSWRKINQKVKKDVRYEAKAIVSHGDGLILGGALGVDFVATEEALKLDPTAQKLKIFLPTSLEIYVAHYRRRAKEGVITKKQAEDLITQLEKIKKINPHALFENRQEEVVNEETYYQRNSAIIEAADELIAFRVNQSLGMQDAINKARKKGIPVKVFSYSIK